jgi:hypothetical protein
MQKAARGMILRSGEVGTGGPGLPGSGPGPGDPHRNSIVWCLSLIPRSRPRCKVMAFVMCWWCHEAGSSYPALLAAFSPSSSPTLFGAKPFDYESFMCVL